MYTSIENIMSDRYPNIAVNCTGRVTISKYRFEEGDKYMIIEIITEEGCSTPCLIESANYSRREINQIMDYITAAL